MTTRTIRIDEDVWYAANLVAVAPDGRDALMPVEYANLSGDPNGGSWEPLGLMFIRFTPPEGYDITCEGKSVLVPPWETASSRRPPRRSSLLTWWFWFPLASFARWVRREELRKLTCCDSDWEGTIDGCEQGM
jgi:hypothetical protein